MILFDIEKTLDSISDKVFAFLDKNSMNPIFWSLLAGVIVAFGFWGISYFNKR